MLGEFPRFLLEAKISNTRDSAFYFYVRHYRRRHREGQTQTQTLQTLWCVLWKDTTGVDTARVRHRLRLCKHCGAYYGKTRQASTPRGSDADLDYKNTEVEFPEILAAVDINL